MAEVKVGDVRREPPRIERSGRLGYSAAPFVVVSIEPSATGRIPVKGVSGKPLRLKSLAAVSACPLWPSEHEQWQGARGYEVKI